MNDTTELIKYTHKKGKESIFPTHDMVKNWLFEEGQEEEAMLVNSLASVAEKNGLNQNDLQHLFPAILRMLRSDIEWANQKKI